MFKLIITDLDETLLNDEREISEQDLKTIHHLREKGVKLVLSSGRPFSSMEGILKKMKIDGKEDEYVISFNGGVIQNTRGRILSLNTMDYDLANALYQIGKKAGVGIHVYTLENTYGTNLDSDEMEYIQGRLEIKEFQDPDLEKIRNEQFVKIIYFGKDMDYLKRFREKIRDYDDKIEVSYSSGRYLEMNKRGVSKGFGLFELAKILDLSPQDIIAVGDNFNDLSMIQAAGLGVGVSNCNKDVRERFDVILDATNNDNPMTEVARRFIEKTGSTMEKTQKKREGC